MASQLSVYTFNDALSAPPSRAWRCWGAIDLLVWSRLGPHMLETTTPRRGRRSFSDGSRRRIDANDAFLPDVRVGSSDKIHLAPVCPPKTSTAQAKIAQKRTFRLARILLIEDDI